MFNLKYGSTRTVILIGKYAIKFPSTVSLKLFLNGWIANIQEWEWHTVSDKLCPVKHNFLGLIIVMERCYPLERKEFFELNFNEFVEESGIILPIENKMDSFGKLKDKVVAVDYGS